MYPRIFCSTSTHALEVQEAPFLFLSIPLQSSGACLYDHPSSCALSPLPPPLFLPSGLPYLQRLPSLLHLDAMANQQKEREHKDAQTGLQPFKSTVSQRVWPIHGEMKYRQAIALEARCIVRLFKSNQSATGAGHVFNSGASQLFFVRSPMMILIWLLLLQPKAQHVLVRTRTWDGSRESVAVEYMSLPTTPTLLLLESRGRWLVACCAGAVGRNWGMVGMAKRFFFVFSVLPFEQQPHLSTKPSRRRSRLGVRSILSTVVHRSIRDGSRACQPETKTFQKLTSDGSIRLPGECWTRAIRGEGKVDGRKHLELQSKRFARHLPLTRKKGQPRTE